MTPRVVLTSGVFDLMHRGHLNLLWRSKALGNVLVVGVLSDAGTAARKGVTPAEREGARMAAVAALPFVDVAVVQATADPTALIERYLPDVLTHGEGWEPVPRATESMRRFAVEFVSVPYTRGVSSTALREVAV